MKNGARIMTVIKDLHSLFLWVVDKAEKGGSLKTPALFCYLFKFSLRMKAIRFDSERPSFSAITRNFSYSSAGIDKHTCLFAIVFYSYLMATCEV